MDFRLSVPVLDQNCWPALPQTLVNEIFEKTRGQLQDLTGVIASATAPAPEDQDKLWVKLDGFGRPLNNFIYAGGLWLWPHPVAASSGFRWMWAGNPADIPTLDGGTAGIATPTTGPFWEIATEFEGRSPMGVGAIPGANPAKSIASGEQFGEGAHTQLADEVGPHTHEPSPKIMATSPGSGSVQGILFGGTGDARPDLAVLANTYSAGTQSAMPVVHPVLGIYFLKRTQRQWLTG